MNTPLLATKLFTPTPGSNLVPRARLIEKLNDCLSQRLTLISAPAGFGKSTLVSACAQQSKPETHIAWLSLDEGDNDLVRFLTYFTAALQTIESGIGQGVQAALQSPEGVNIEAVLATLLNDISVFPGQMVLILDDYHLIESQPVDEAVTFILDHMPPQMHLVVTSRIDPSWPLARLRVRGQLIEIRADDLRFTPEEAAAFLNQVMGFNLSTRDVAALEARTEGWIAGLQMAALSMKGSRDVQEFVRSFTGSNRYILDYLGEEVLARQPQPVQDFLLLTSVLDRLSGPLCDAVAESRGGEEMLESLERDNLFLVPLDNERRWYRYHHLFGDLLEHHTRRTLPDQIPGLHRRASLWYEKEGYLDDAIHHALAAGDKDRLTGMLERNWQVIIHRGEFTRLKGLLDTLGPEITRCSAPLSMAYCWMYAMTENISPIRGHINDIRAVWDRAAEEEVPQPGHTAVIPSLVETMEAIIALDGSQAGEAKEHALRAISLIPEDARPEARGLLHGAAGYRLAEAYKALGELDQACEVYLQVLEMLKASQNYFGAAAAVLEIVLLYQKSGLIGAAVSLCEEMIDYIQNHGWEKIPTSGFIYILLAGLQVDKGEFESARKNLEKGQKLAESVQSNRMMGLVAHVEAQLSSAAMSPQPLVEPLSQREEEVLSLLTKGLSNREISEKLFLALDTIKGHNRNIFGKLGVKNRTQAVSKARELEIIPTP